MLGLGVLDQTPIRSGGTAIDSINETLDLAVFAEELGYKRYWLAEHHGSDGLAGCAPEILIPKVAEATSQIRVGSGGIMLSHYSPLKIAETFSLLSTMHPGRIDLGLGRAPGGNPLTSMAMAYGSNIGVEYYPTKVVDLKSLLLGTRPANSAFSKLKIVPLSDQPPEIWLLGSSAESAKIAAELGLSFSFAHFINANEAEKNLGIYRSNFKSSEGNPSPFANICISVIVAETQEEANFHALSRKLWRLQLSKGELGLYPSPEEALSYNYNEKDKQIVDSVGISGLVGTPDIVKREIERIAHTCQVNEVMILTITHDVNARAKSYELIRKAFSG